MSTSSRASSRHGGRRGREGISYVTPLYTPKSLVKNYSLPVAAYFQNPDGPPGVDTSEPLLLYKSYSSRKVRAVSLNLNKENELVSAGPTLVIPDTYAGWFSVINSKGKSAAYFSTIEEVSRAHPLFFLTRFDLTAYVKEFDSADANKIKYRKTSVPGGHVLKLLGIFEDLNRRSTATPSGDYRRRPEGTKYLQCLNYCNQVIFIPFGATGRFYETAERGSSNTNNVFLISQILSTFQLPLRVRLVCGYLARVPESFTGILRLEKVGKEAVILGCSITSEAKATLLEMEIDSNFLLRPISDPLYSKTPIFLKSLSYCSEEADSWQRQIKVIHHVTEGDSWPSLRSSSDSNSLSTNSLGSNFSFLSNFDKLRNKGRNRSLTRLDKNSNNIKFKEKIKDNDKRESQDIKENKSRDSKIKVKVKDKILDRSRNNHCVATEEFISIRLDEKLSGKKCYDNRKIAKQNTYIFQNEKTQKQEKVERIESSEGTCKISVGNFDEYATVLDDISSFRTESKYIYSESQYAEIGDQVMANRIKVKIDHPSKNKS